MRQLCDRLKRLSYNLVIITDRFVLLKLLTDIKNMDTTVEKELTEDLTNPNIASSSKRRIL